jgi:hypothetical protein
MWFRVSRVVVDPEPRAIEAVVYRSARRLMQGEVLVPRARLKAAAMI